MTCTLAWAKSSPRHLHILPGCMQAAAECLKACTLTLGPMMEPEGAWDPGDARSLTARCSKALEGAKFDKVQGRELYIGQGSEALHAVTLWGGMGLKGN